MDFRTYKAKNGEDVQLDVNDMQEHYRAGLFTFTEADLLTDVCVALNVEKASAKKVFIELLRRGLESLNAEQNRIVLNIDDYNFSRRSNEKTRNHSKHPKYLETYRKLFEPKSVLVKTDSSDKLAEIKLWINQQFKAGKTEQDMIKALKSENKNLTDDALRSTGLFKSLEKTPKIEVPKLDFL